MYYFMMIKRMTSGAIKQILNPTAYLQISVIKPMY